MIICGSLPRLKIFSVRIGRRVEVVIWLAKCQSAEQGGDPGERRGFYREQNALLVGEGPRRHWPAESKRRLTPQALHDRSSTDCTGRQVPGETALLTLTQRRDRYRYCYLDAFHST